jgi:hypothetical protein
MPRVRRYDAPVPYAHRIPDLISKGPPAAAGRVDRLAATLGLRLSDEYRALLAEANGLSANLVQIYPAEDVPERNATCEVARYAPGYFVIGTVNDCPVLLRGGGSSPVFANDWGAMSPEVMRELAPSLGEWIDAGCPDDNPATD